MRYAVFFISDQTGITTESMGHALLSQFEHCPPFYQETLPFIKTPAAAQNAAQHIHSYIHENPGHTLIFSSLVDEHLRRPFKNIPSSTLIDFFAHFIPCLEEVLETHARPKVGLQHGIQDTLSYDARMEAVNFTLEYDDGIKTKHLDQADVILVGVSRSGKTPTCLYLALHHGIKAGNYPLLPEDLSEPDLPKALQAYRQKIIALSIDPKRLHHIRQERRPNSQYADLRNCRQEVLQAERMFQNERLLCLNTTHQSVEEVATLVKTRLSSMKVSQKP
jgi:regulator of PEP synthase PpsR (kinase-PPPase family)